MTTAQVSNARGLEVKGKVELAEFVVVCVLALGIPLFFKHPQLLVGSVVNALIVCTALNFSDFRKVLPAIVLPSVGAVLGGYLFGPFTVFLVYMVPFIWVGNGILAVLVRTFYRNQQKNYVLALVAASLLKYVWLFAAASVLFKLGVVPKPIVVAMGVTQLYTALIGGAVAWPISYGLSVLSRRSGR
ncbi:hypothetical protein HPY42_06245 [Coprothermobacteraceae bacterium]|nr:hypothetical protein [Coprothermobacteraceae bacterium]